MENENQDLMDRYLSTIHELNHEKIRREGFERELQVQKGIVDSFAGNLIRIGNECRDHALEVKRLKAESVKDAAQLWEQSNEIKRLNSLIANSEQENARLKAEVERLTKQNALATPRSLIASQDIKTLREQVERLTKAGDALAGEAIRLEYSNYWSEYEKVEDVCIDEVEAWHKAKGVQS